MLNEENPNPETEPIQPERPATKPQPETIPSPKENPVVPPAPEVKPNRQPEINPGKETQQRY